MSVRRSTFSPRACSGDMYAVFPLRTPGSSLKSVAAAMPKSATFTAPSKLNKIFCGETSRCTMERALPPSSLRSWA